QPYSFGFHIKVWRGTLEDDGYGHRGDPEEDFEVSWVAPTVVSEQFLRPIAMDTALEAPSSGAPLAIEEALTVYLAY
ncbi:hypothetical protein ACP3WZ_26545, partial [Salmonella enterica]|uniref:hypothetical protein n=1 Tax=Salmonella enterica TaxID=28901 RepID=UPI003CF669FA